MAVSRVSNATAATAVAGLHMVTPTSVVVSGGTGSVAGQGAVTFSGTTSVLLNGCFTSNYDNYKIVISNLTSSAGNLLSYQMSSAGSAVSTSTYSHQRNYTQGTSTGGERTGPTTSSSLSYVGTGALNYISFEVMNPFLSTITKTISIGNYSDPTFPYYIDIFNGYHSTAASYDGIRIFSVSTLTGTIRVYGYNNGGA
jgi:hypothetical protein